MTASRAGTLDLGLRGRKALITGGSRGVGRATAIMLARAGAEVGIGYLTRAEDARSAVREMSDIGANACSVAADLTTPVGSRELFDHVEAKLGGIDIFIANAGVWPSSDVPLSEMRDDQWLSTIESNLTSVFLTARIAARRVSEGGRIVIVSSTAGQRGEAFHADYAASKGALISLTKSLAIELAPRGVTVNCVAPGWIDTEMVEGPFAGDGRAAIERSIPLRRVAAADDVAGPIVFLCSHLARHITGEVLNVNGGSVLCG
jgi:3-oxoacyl-[acyl-carrier protein] reductase